MNELALQLAGFFGIPSVWADKIVTAISSGAGFFVIMSLVMTVVTAGAAGVTAAAMDYAIYTVKNLVARSMRAQAVVF